MFHHCVLTPLKQNYRQMGIPHTFFRKLSPIFKRLRGLEVACRPLVPKFVGSHPAETVGFLGRKNPQYTLLRRESKAVSSLS